MNNFTNPAVQMMNLIRYIGDLVAESGRPIDQILATDIQSAIGAPSEEFAEQLIDELHEMGVIRMADPMRTSQYTVFRNVNLTLKGWEQYEAEKRGEFEGNYGFIAMQFGDTDLDAFVREVVKPAVKDGIGYDLVDMRDVGRAGIIDNIMRVQIRDSAFVIADLTHDNNGAYWEAGYAEGLGKPVIYICEKTKFDNEKSHFDTNHCTTVPWSKNDAEDFKQELIATIRRSLNTSPTANGGGDTR